MSLAAASSRTFAGLSWSAPVVVEHAPPFAPAEFGVAVSVACPRVSFCVASSEFGAVVTSRDPGRARAWSAPVQVFSGGFGSRVSCPSVMFCVAVDGSAVAVSRNPSGSARTWRVSHVVSSSTSLVAVACPSVSLCVAIDDRGEVLSSRDPAGGATAWMAVPVEAGTLGVSDQLQDLSCPSVSFCAAVDTAGNVLSSTDPSGGRSAWRIVNVDPAMNALRLTPGLGSVSCASRRLCIALSHTGDVATSTDPTGDAGAWRVRHVRALEGATSGVACVSGTLCLAVGGRTVAFSRDPTAPASRWNTRNLGPRTESVVGQESVLAGISCPSRSLCVIAAARAIATSSKPTAQASAWRVVTFGATNILSAISCPMASLCAADDDDGHIVTSGRPAAGARTWRTISLPDSPLISGVSCPSRSLCVATAGPSVAVSRDPTGGPGSWRTLEPARPAGEPALGQIGPVYCASVKLCVVLAGSDVLVSTSPTGGQRAWHAARIDEASVQCGEFPEQTCPANLAAVACPTTSLCVAVDDQGNVVTSTDPTAGPSAWTLRNVGIESQNPTDGTVPPPTISCASTHLCAIANYLGYVDTSTNPAGPAGAWVHTNLHDAGSQTDPNGLTGVSCAPISSCVVIDGAGHVFTSSNPAAQPTQWTRTTISAEAPLAGVSCSGTFCAAISEDTAIIGRR